MISIKSKQHYDHMMDCSWAPGADPSLCTKCGRHHAPGWTITRTLSYDHAPELYYDMDGSVMPECLACGTTHPPTRTTELRDLFASACVPLGFAIFLLLVAVGLLG